MLPPIADVNWLLSALAQSSAALVAIVGGLLVSRYVALHAEQQAARRRVDDLRRTLEIAVESLRQARRDLDIYDVDFYLEDRNVYEEVLKLDFTPDIEALRRAVDGGDHLVDEVLRERLEHLASDMRTASELLQALVPHTEEQQEWEEFRHERQLKLDWSDAWQFLYERISHGRRVRAGWFPSSGKERERVRDHGLGLPDFPIVSAVPFPGILRVRDRSEENRLVRLRDDAAARHAALLAEIELAERHLQDSRQPQGFRLALWVLAYLAVVGIGLPVVVMANGPTELPVWGRTAIVAAFFSGLLLLLRFLFVYAAYLDESRRREELPPSVWGLLRL
jgi:hypothetical protein